MTEEPIDEVTDSGSDASPSNEGEVPEGSVDDVTAAEVERTDAETIEALTAELQRERADYLNYKRRAERERDQAKQRGRDDVLASLLTVLDDLGRAAEHGELVGGFKAVADSLRQILTGHGLEEFGEANEPFDPNWHEAVQHAGESPEVTVQSIAHVLRTGFRVGERVLRPATVVVVDPAAPASSESADDEKEEENK